jgi:hypothetical protein
VKKWLGVLLLAAGCAGGRIAEDEARPLLTEALSGPSGLLFGLCPEAPPAHESFTALVSPRLAILAQEPRRLRFTVRGEPATSSEQGDQIIAHEVVCEGEIEASFARDAGHEGGWRVEQIRVVRGRRPGATFY